MPAPLVKSLAKKAGISNDEAEKRWSKAKARAKEQGREGEYDYITGIFKRMLGLGESRLKSSRMMEATVTGMIPATPNPLQSIGPFSEDERRQIVSRIKSLFPEATETAIEKAVFGHAIGALSENDS